jgi:glucokinase
MKEMLQEKSDNSRIIPHNAPVATGDGCLVGIDIGGTSLRVALATVTGSILAKWTASTAGLQDPQAIVALIRSGVDHLLRETSVTASSIRAVAAGAPGVTDVDAGVVIATSYLMGWRDVPLRALLESTFHVPAAIDNDVNVAALGESWAGSAMGTSDFVFLAIGTGVGAGIMLNGKLFRGMGWIAGEIGYMLVPGTSVVPAGDGMPGALESDIGGEGIKARWRAMWSENNTSLPRNLLATQIFDHALEGERLAQTFLNQTAQTLAYAIYNIALILNCPLFVLGGTVGIHPALCAAAQTFLDERAAQVQPQLRRSALGADAQLIGAIRLAMSIAVDKAAITP